jgi:hypothetical protein
MANFVLAYTGGGMAATQEQQAASMAAWGAWMEGLGERLVEGGSPFGGSATVGPDGTVRPGGAAGLTGYSVISADDLAAATTATKGCPIFADGGSVQVYEALPVM